MQIPDIGPLVALSQLPHSPWYGIPTWSQSPTQQIHLDWNYLPEKSPEPPDLRPPPKSDSILIPLKKRNPIAYIPFILFIISEIVLGLVGFYLSAADKNSHWNYARWNRTSDATYAAAVGGGVEGTLLPFAFFYSAEVIGSEATIVTAIVGAYLGGAAANERWDPTRWNWNTPKTINGIFEGIQNTVWLIDAIASIHSFVRDAGLGDTEKGVFLVAAYATGALISFWYIAQEMKNNFKFWQWDLKSPVIVYGIVRGFESGTRIPVGFGEVGVSILDSIEKSMEKPEFFPSVIDNFIVRNRWKVAGALWLAIVYTSEENETLDIFKWDKSSPATLEAFVNGLVFGKDLDEMFIDVRKYLLGGGNNYQQNDNYNTKARNSYFDTRPDTKVSIVLSS